MARLVYERADLLPLLGEVFREHGFEGASLAVISRRTGLGKGSLYHFFPGGKEEMAAAVLAHVDHWFETQVFRPLREEPDGRRAITAMLEATDAYFRSGRRVCVVGVFALAESRDRFAVKVASYFSAWIDALAGALGRAGHPPDDARALSEEAVGLIQGALVLARALDDPAPFARTLARLKARLVPERPAP
ncbi:TetR/AcrR family transcriptional regulator [Aquabacter spiritensis]|uniref:TetR family transcriptional regulator n=1 Tax=Aquabacter spiritensis TaxID=933073 RepID=A0A4R3M9C8_9HYPH|nr:TetR/AcrR family transcriptional regulator [Aquabacter spiritensis]TCT07985.1 TetR family transcriptional regulator [Aquabacter spiritensis]